MRTKTLCLAAVLAAVAISSLSAQVYSVNAVGYVNVPLPKGFSLISNPLKAATNTVAALMPAVPEGTIVYKLNADGTYAQNVFDFGAWTDAAMKLEPGEGAYVNNAGAATTVTFVGEVVQGDTKNQMPKGFSIRSSIVPQTGQLSKDLGFPAADGDIVYKYDNAKGGYDQFVYDFGEWTPSDPTINVGQSFFVNKTAAVDWNRNFSVNQ